MLTNYKANRLTLFLLALALLVLSGIGYVSAQDGETPDQPEATDAPTEPPDEPEATEPPTEEPTEIPAISVSTSEPGQVTAGNSGTLSVFGTNFTANSRVRLVGVGLLETQFVNSGSLTAALPETLVRGEYIVEVSDPERGTAQSPNRLRVSNPPNTAAPPPTEAPLPTETIAPTETTVPTAIPGQPSLIVRNFSANPASIAPGGTTTITFEVVNQGSRPALGVSVSVDSGGKFVPANGQSGATLPDLPIGAMVGVTLSVVSAMDTTAGAQSIPITFTFHDFEGAVYTSKATLSVNVQERAEFSQVTLARYQTDPNPVVPGEPVIVTILVTNTGNETASSVLLRVAGADSILLAGPQGDSFPLGDLAAGASTGLDLPLVVSPDADAGPQSQPITIGYLQNGEAKESAGSMTVVVEEVITPEPLLLLDSYDIGADVLKPGDRFTLDMTLQNVGDADATNLLVTFGTVESSGNGGDAGAGNDTTGGGSSTSTTPSTTFAPLGAGGTAFVGTIALGGGTAALTQEFIVNGTVDSGIYSLPITLRYSKPDGTTAQDNLRASVVVIAPPKLQTNLQSPLPEMANVGEPFPLALELVNNGTDRINLSNGVVAVDNGEVIEGAETLLGPLAADEDAAINALVMPLDEGPVHVTVTLNFINDLNQPETLVFTYDTEAVMPSPPPIEEPVIDFTPEPVETPTNDDTLGRLLLGLLGLGS